MSTFILTCGLIIGYLSTPDGIETFSWAYDHWCPLISTALAIALLQNVFFYAQSYWSGELLAEGGNSGYFIYDVRLCSGNARYEREKPDFQRASSHAHS
jgi:delta14-sterol reductase